MLQLNFYWAWGHYYGMLMSMGTLQTNFYWAWGYHRGMLMNMGTLLRNVNEHGDAIEEF